MARPRKELDKKVFENLCGLQCTKPEIAGVLDVSEDTIDRWCKRTYGKMFSEVFAQHSASGKISLRRSQFKLAERSAAMAIWLGKQYLGQRDVYEIEDNDALSRLDSILAGVKAKAKKEEE